MIKAVLVDDEKPALRELEFLLKKFAQIEISGMYTDPAAALEDIGEIKPQLVFLDINMPQLRGTDLASVILDKSPDTEIVFVTAYDQYAIEAFEIHALDYVLKPVSQERLEKTIIRVFKRKALEVEKPPKKLQIRCLGQFRVAWEHQEPIKWRSEKTRELFAYLLQNNGRDISKEELLDRLWPEDDPEKAIRQLYNGIYYIRKALEEYGVQREQISIGSNYNLKLGEVCFDVSRFYEFEKGNTEESIEVLKELDVLYSGDYLEGEYYTWMDFERERLSALHLLCLIRLSEMLLAEKKFERAEHYLLKAYKKDPYEERISGLLMRLYIETGNQTKAVRHFNTYSGLLKEDLGIKPHEKLQEMVRGVIFNDYNT